MTHPAAHHLRPCTDCVTRLTFGSVCSECIASRTRQRALRALIVALLRSFGCR